MTRITDETRSAVRRAMAELDEGRLDDSVIDFEDDEKLAALKREAQARSAKRQPTRRPRGAHTA